MKTSVLILIFLSSSFFLLSQNQDKSILPDSLKHIEKAIVFQQGYLEAQKNYKGNKEIFNAAFATILPLGLVIDALIINNPVKVEKEKLSDRQLLSDPFFIKGYQAGAHRKKVKKVLIGAGIGVSVKVGVLIFLIASPSKGNLFSGGSFSIL